MHPTFFVTGTDTGVGKTVLSAALCRAWGAAYWKPLQTGAQDGDNDTREVARLAGLRPQQVFAPARVYAGPFAPEWAATLEGTRVSVAEVLAGRPAPAGPLIVEGAGGVLVPVNEQETMLDLMAALGAPVIVAARSALGTINHTLLTVGALRARGLRVHGVVLIGPPAPHNRGAIERHGAVRVLADLPPLGRVTTETVAQAAALFGPLEPLHVH
ncbi:dethiobiotin synthase [Deinococcus aquaedulcis]|uniref:dethiobiotin synthase n=1 Tax=Deinococcus aquaedulcis TaxID=2840455 RepID=UPI002E283953|nr:dethiobiotin synthase [Deinococcus aquaedulcis]